MRSNQNKMGEVQMHLAIDPNLVRISVENDARDAVAQHLIMNMQLITHIDTIPHFYVQTWCIVLVYQMFFGRLDYTCNYVHFCLEFSCLHMLCVITIKRCMTIVNSASCCHHIYTCNQITCAMKVNYNSSQ